MGLMNLFTRGLISYTIYFISKEIVNGGARLIKTCADNITTEEHINFPSPTQIVYR